MSPTKHTITWRAHKVLPEPVGKWPLDLLSMDGIPVADAGQWTEMSTADELRGALEAVLNVHGTADLSSRWAYEGDRLDELIAAAAKYEHAVESFRVRRGDDDSDVLVVIRVSCVRLTRYDHILAGLEYSAQYADGESAAVRHTALDSLPAEAEADAASEAATRTAAHGYRFTDRTRLRP